MVKNKIILTAEAELVDEGAREYCSILDTRVATINERTKNHTIDIKKLEKEIKELKKGKDWR